jgi:hypothetical protein
MRVAPFRFQSLKYRHRCDRAGISLSSTERFPSLWPICDAIQKGDHNGYRFEEDVHFLCGRRGSLLHRRVLDVPSDTVSSWMTLSC